MKFEPSITEEHGLNLLKPNFKRILSLGISTGGSAELRMAELCPDATITATTVDEKGLAMTKKILESYPNDTKIKCKLEDCSKPYPYSDNYFDYIYARLVLHYLSKNQLQIAVKEIYRTLKKGQKAFIVVRSIDENELKIQKTTYDEKTGYTTYIPFCFLDNPNPEYKRTHFFSEDSLRKTFENAGFKIEYIKTVSEHLFHDYERTIRNSCPNTLIEAVMTK